MGDQQRESGLDEGYRQIAESAAQSASALAREHARAIGYTDEELAGVPPDAAVSLGCGNPVAIAELRPGETVLDLGPGLGLDVFLAANAVGPEGRVIGVDRSPEMVQRVRQTADGGGYSSVILHVGEIENPDGVGEVGNPVCGDMMTFYIKVKDNRLEDVKFKTFGCGAAIAVSSMVSEMARGKTIEEALKITPESVADELEGLPKQKFHCSNLGAQALHKAIEDYQKKKGGK